VKGVTEDSYLELSMSIVFASETQKQPQNLHWDSFGVNVVL
jgi:hypothetical protein